MNAPALARNAVRAELRVMLNPDADVVINNILVVLSELVTNAVRAGSDTVTVAMDLHRDVVQLEVIDEAAGWPEIQPASSTRGHGRGLAIVDVLAAAWGVRSTRPGRQGKVVWADVALRDGVASTIGCHRAG